MNPVWLVGSAMPWQNFDGDWLEAIERPVHISELHATILHLMGLDHRALSWFYQGLDQRLTGVEERQVVKEVLSS